MSLKAGEKRGMTIKKMTIMGMIVMEWSLFGDGRSRPALCQTPMDSPTRPAQSRADPGDVAAHVAPEIEMAMVVAAKATARPSVGSSGQGAEWRQTWCAPSTTERYCGHRASLVT